MFSTFQDAAFFGFGVFFFLVCFACKTFVVRTGWLSCIPVGTSLALQLVEYKDCKRDWLNERDFLREAYIATGTSCPCCFLALPEHGPCRSCRARLCLRGHHFVRGRWPLGLYGGRTFPVHFACRRVSNGFLELHARPCTICPRAGGVGAALSQTCML